MNKLKKTKKLKLLTKPRSVKNWKWHLDINPDGVWKPKKRRVRKQAKENTP